MPQDAGDSGGGFGVDHQDADGSRSRARDRWHRLPDEHHLRSLDRLRGRRQHLRRDPERLADDFPCEAGGFELESSTEGDFEIHFTRSSGGQQLGYVQIHVTDVHGDRDVGTVQF